MYIFLLITFQNISCEGWSKTIIKGIYFTNDKNKSYFEDSKFALKQMWNNMSLLILYILFVVSIALYNLVEIK